MNTLATGLQAERDRTTGFAASQLDKQTKNLKQNDAQNARAESTHKRVNQRSKDVTRTTLTET